MKNRFASVLPRFTPHWDYQHKIEYNGQKINCDRLAILSKIEFGCDWNDGSVVNALTHLIVFNFVLDKSLGYIYFVNMKQYTKKNKQTCFKYYIFLLRRWWSWRQLFRWKKINFTLKLVTDQFAIL